MLNQLPPFLRQPDGHHNQLDAQLLELTPPFAPLKDVLLAQGSPERTQEDYNRGIFLCTGFTQNFIHGGGFSIKVVEGFGSNSLTNVKFVSDIIRRVSREYSVAPTVLDLGGFRRKVGRLG
jgi:hypothetical protein